MSARQEKVREALDWFECESPDEASTARYRAALAEVEEWEAERARLTEPFVARDQLPAAFTLMKARAEAAEARIVELEAALRNPGGTDL